MRELQQTLAAARESGVPAELPDALAAAWSRVNEVGAQLRKLGEPARALAHSADYLDMFSTIIVAWLWLKMASASQRALDGAAGERDRAFHRGKLQAAHYWFATELPRVPVLAQLCTSGESSYLDMQEEWF